MVDDCLDEIEKDSSLSEVTNETLQRARQRVRDSLDVQTRVFKLQNIRTWLQMSDSKCPVRCLSLSLKPVGVCVTEHSCILTVNNLFQLFLLAVTRLHRDQTPG